MPTTKIRFTQAAVSKIDAPKRNANGALGVSWYRDESLHSPSGLRLRVNSSGRKDWYYRYTSQGKSQFTSIGSFPDLGLDSARKGAKTLAAQVANGGDPVVDRKKASAENRLSDISLSDALELHLLNRAHDHKATTIKGYRQAFSSTRTGFIPWMKKPVKTISRKQVEAWYLSLIHI